MEENQVYIPEGWESYVGNEILKVQGGYAFKSNDYRDEGILLVRIGNVGNGSFVFKDVIYVPKRFQLTHSNFQLWKGDVLMGLTGDLGKICILKEGDYPYFLNQRVGKFVATDKIDNEYLYYLVSSSFIQSKFDAFFAGGAQKNISPKQIESINYLIPNSKKEQTQIATILSKVDEAIAQTEQLIAKYTRIKTGLMQDLLTKGIDENGNIRSEETHEFKDSPLGRIPKEWECEMLGNIFDLKTGITPLRSNSLFFAHEGYNWVKTLDLNEDDLFESEEKITEYALNKTAIQLRPVGTILIAMYGGWQQIGRTSILKSEAATNQAITALINPKVKMYSEFLQLFLQQNRWRWKQFAVSTRKDPNITKNDIAKFYVLYPKVINEQKLVADKILTAKKMAVQYSQNLSKLQSLKTGLMQDLLSGKVRVNHLIKETASV